MSSVTDGGGGEADLTWQRPSPMPDQHFGFAWDLYTEDWVQDVSPDGMWYPFPGSAQSGTMDLGHSGGYHVWMSSQYSPNGWFVCNNPWTGIIYNGQPHVPANISSQGLGSRRIRIQWKPDWYGTWIYWVIVYKENPSNQGYHLVQGPLGNSYWHYMGYGSSQVDLTVPYTGDYWVFLFAHGWDGTWSEAAVDSVTAW